MSYKQEVFDQLAKTKNDTGSLEVQVGLLTLRIKSLSDHMKSNKHDFHSRRGLLQMVGRRKRILRYLKDNDFVSYQKVISILGLRK
jgi:small subunit ribosomal protein S15